MSVRSQVDIAIVGGGMVGSACAALLSRCGFTVALLESRRPAKFDPAQPVGLRVSALSPGSAAILEQAGAWKPISNSRNCAYQRMTVEDRDAGSVMEFTGPQFGLERLGTIVENDLILDALWQSVETSPMVELHCPAQMQDFTDSDEAVVISLAGGGEIKAELLIGADGASSRVRKMMGAGEDIWEYNQAALVSVVRKSLRNPGTAWQRFLSGGPLAFLPLSDGSSSIVWSLPTAEARRLQDASDEEFIAALQEASDGWSGDVVSTGPRGMFPLNMRLSDRFVAGRVVLLGDAAHRVHPLAGQGVNMGFADVAALVETLVATKQAGKRLSNPVALRKFERWRRSESTMMAKGVHAIGALFGPDELSLARKLGMRFVAGSWTLGDVFVRQAGGLGHNAPRLSQGESLRQLLSDQAP